VTWGCRSDEVYRWPPLGECDVPSRNTGFIGVSAGVASSGAIQRLPGDFDADGYGTLLDYQAFVDRFQGPGVEGTELAWQFFDRDGDGDVDASDFAAFQNVFGFRP